MKMFNNQQKKRRGRPPKVQQTGADENNAEDVVKKSLCAASIKRTASVRTRPAAPRRGVKRSATIKVATTKPAAPSAVTSTSVKQQELPTTTKINQINESLTTALPTVTINNTSTTTSGLPTFTINTTTIASAYAPLAEASNTNEEEGKIEANKPLFEDNNDVETNVLVKNCTSTNSSCSVSMKKTGTQHLQKSKLLASLSTSTTTNANQNVNNNNTESTATNFFSRPIFKKQEITDANLFYKEYNRTKLDILNGELVELKKKEQQHKQQQKKQKQQKTITSNSNTLPSVAILEPSDDEIENENSCNKLRMSVQNMKSPFPQLTWSDTNDLWKCMHLNERQHKHSPHYLQQHLGIDQQMRAILIDWLQEISYAYRLHRETFHLSVELLDRFMTQCVKHAMRVDRLQLIGLTSLFIAAKVEEIYPPKLKDFASHLDDYSSDNVDAMQQFELFMLKTLGWQISPVTANTWLAAYLQIASINLHHQNQQNQHQQHSVVSTNSSRSSTNKAAKNKAAKLSLAGAGGRRRRRVSLNSAASAIVDAELSDEDDDEDKDNETNDDQVEEVEEETTSNDEKSPPEFNSHFVMPLNIYKNSDTSDKNRFNLKDFLKRNTNTNTNKNNCDIGKYSKEQQTFYLNNYMKAVTLLDLCLFDMDSLRFGYSLIAAAALYHMISFEKNKSSNNKKKGHNTLSMSSSSSASYVSSMDTDLLFLDDKDDNQKTQVISKCSGYSQLELSTCIKWMYPYADACRIVITESKMIQVKQFENIQQDDAHNIQLYYQNLDILKIVQSRKTPCDFDSNASSVCPILLTPPGSVHKYAHN